MISTWIHIIKHKAGNFHLKHDNRASNHQFEKKRAFIFIVPTLHLTFLFFFYPKLKLNVFTLLQKKKSKMSRNWVLINTLWDIGNNGVRTNAHCPCFDFCAQKSHDFQREELKKFSQELMSSVYGLVLST